MNFITVKKSFALQGKKKKIPVKMKCQAKDWDKVFINYQYAADKK